MCMEMKVQERQEHQVEESEEIEKLLDRGFNPWRMPRAEKAWTVIKDVLNQLQNFERYYSLRRRRRKQADQQIFEDTVAAVASDLMYHHILGHGEGVFITRSNQILGRRSRYRPSAYGKTLPDILDRMTAPEMAFVELAIGHEGHFGPAKRTTIRAGEKLISRIVTFGLRLKDFIVSPDQEVIQLKRAKGGFWDEGDLQEYDDTSEIVQFREQVRAINDWLDEAEIDFDEALWPGGKPVDTLDRRLRRVFTLGRFDHGGRLFGGFWQALSKRQRLEGLSIDGEDVVELDYGQMNPRIVYGLNKAQPPAGDAYSVPGYEAHREGVKKVMNAMLFATKRLTRMPRGVRKTFEGRQRVEDVMTAIEQAHPAITSSFFTGLGHRAQFIESQVLVDVLLSLRASGIHALPIHDSVIVGRSNKDKAREVMLSSFFKVTGVPGVVEEVKG